MNQSGAIAWRSVGKTRKGADRELNQDAFLCRPEAGIWAVADGMGGHDAGDTASVGVITALAMLGGATSLSELIGDAKARLRAVNDALGAASKDRSRGAGSTVVALLSHGTHIAVLWAGDSRAYLLRDGKLEQLSVDHTRVQQLVGEGLLSADEAASHPKSNVITRAIGVMADIEFDTRILNVAVGDTYLLCSDGLHREIARDDIAKHLAADDCEGACDRLVAAAHEGDDDISVIVVRAGAGRRGPDPGDLETQTISDGDATIVDMTQLADE